ncbi:Uu.00g107570.m01.CDS01 [Anthostomella pinea]|uniref:Uu.00g107570.m01.CDS01 n=1 Tax=Anthostomella pinea TaxID=933095 RepID=A0AAI8VEE0_9PEZI|nr:Uu.00g107570.m01.CDS01 [Anthostomella pinea]
MKSTFAATIVVFATVTGRVAGAHHNPDRLVVEFTWFDFRRAELVLFNADKNTNVPTVQPSYVTEERVIKRNDVEELEKKIKDGVMNGQSFWKLMKLRSSCRWGQACKSIADAQDNAKCSLCIKFEPPMLLDNGELELGDGYAVDVLSD